LLESTDALVFPVDLMEEHCGGSDEASIVALLNVRRHDACPATLLAEMAGANFRFGRTNSVPVQSFGHNGQLKPTEHKPGKEFVVLLPDAKVLCELDLSRHFSSHEHVRVAEDIAQEPGCNVGPPRDNSGDWAVC